MKIIIIYTDGLHMYITKIIEHSSINTIIVSIYNSFSKTRPNDVLVTSFTSIGRSYRSVLSLFSKHQFQTPHNVARTPSNIKNIAFYIFLKRRQIKFLN